MLLTQEEFELMKNATSVAIYALQDKIDKLERKAKREKSSENSSTSHLIKAYENEKMNYIRLLNSFSK